MKSVAIQELYQTLLCSPGMSETVKVDVRLSRQTILLLSQIIDSGLKQNGNILQTDLFEVIGKSSVEELQEMVQHCLDKASLSALSQRLVQLQQLKS